MATFSRRSALRTLAAAFALVLLRPGRVSAQWNKGAFEAKTVNEALKNMKVMAPIETKDIAISAPDIAENGAMVPVEIQSNISGTASIAVLIDKNPFPYVGKFDVSKGALPFIALRVKIGESSNVRVVVATADGKFYTAEKEVKVTIGGCGG